MTSEKWEIDSGHAVIHFSVRHLVISKVRGTFTRWTGSVQVADGKPETALPDVTIDASSIDTGLADRDTHLKSADFLDVANFAELKFKGKKTEAIGGGKFRTTGDLTIRDVTREVALEVDYSGRIIDPWGNDRAGFSATTSINRKDFGLVWNMLLETGGVAVGDTIEIGIEAELVRQKVAQAA
jgi:polyisoprenoid-binding protein YceI